METKLLELGDRIACMKEDGSKVKLIDEVEG